MNKDILTYLLTYLYIANHMQTPFRCAMFECSTKPPRQDPITLTQSGDGGPKPKLID